MTQARKRDGQMGIQDAIDLRKAAGIIQKWISDNPDEAGYTTYEHARRIMWSLEDYAENVERMGRILDRFE